MPLAERLVPQGDMDFQAGCYRPFVFGVDILDLEIDQQTCRLALKWRRQGSVAVVEDGEVGRGRDVRGEMDVPVGPEGRREAEVTLPEGGGPGDVVGAEDCVELVELHCLSLPRRVTYRLYAI